MLHIPCAREIQSPKCCKCQSSERSKLQKCWRHHANLMRDQAPKSCKYHANERDLSSKTLQRPGKTNSARKREKHPKRKGKQFLKMQPFLKNVLCFYSERLAFGAFGRQDLRRNVQKGVGLKRLQVARSWMRQRRSCVNAEASNCSKIPFHTRKKVQSTSATWKLSRRILAPLHYWWTGNLVKLGQKHQEPKVLYH